MIDLDKTILTFLKPMQNVFTVLYLWTDNDNEFELRLSVKLEYKVIKNQRKRHPTPLVLSVERKQMDIYPDTCKNTKS